MMGQTDSYRTLGQGGLVGNDELRNQNAESIKNNTMRKKGSPCGNVRGGGWYEISPLRNAAHYSGRNDIAGSDDDKFLFTNSLGRYLGGEVILRKI